jgi:hypothetical protein
MTTFTSVYLDTFGRTDGGRLGMIVLTDRE